MVANQACFSRKPAFNHCRSTCRSMGTCVKSHSWLMRSKQALMSPSRIHSWTVPMAQQEMSLSQRIGTAAFPSKAIGMAVGMRFRDGIESEQVECLHGSIGHCGDAHSTLPLHPNRLRDSSPSPIPTIRFAASGSRSSGFAAGTIRISSSVLPDGRHAAIALSSTDYASPPRDSAHPWQPSTCSTSMVCVGSSNCSIAWPNRSAPPSTTGDRVQTKPPRTAVASPHQPRTTGTWIKEMLL